MSTQYILILGEIILAVGASQLLVYGVASKRANSATIVRYIAIALLLMFAASEYLFGPTSGTAFDGALVFDKFGHFVKAVIGVAAAAALFFAGSYLESEKLDRHEYSILTLYAVLGMSIMVSAGNLLTLYIGLEMQSLALYILAAFNRDSLRSSEAGLKYFVLGAISSGLLLYGISLVYGFTGGALEFNAIAAQMGGDMSTGLTAGLVFILCGLAFKISAAPFHMWTPDVYEGSPTPVTGFFASAPKFAAMALIARIVLGPFGEIMEQWQQVIIALSILSMFVGAIGALTQTNIKRLMAYSSIANMGYALVALAPGTPEGLQGLMIFMTIYTLSAVGIFACILQMRIRDGMVEQISDLAGLARTNMGLCIAFTMLFFSVMGMPPLLGFFGKWYAFMPAFDAGLGWLVVVALIASVIGAFYYLRIILTMWMGDREEGFVAPAKSLSFVSTIVAFLLIGSLVIILPMREVIAEAAQSLF